MTAGAKPSVSVVIPTLNAERELPALLDALHGQTLVPGEILVVDSSSDDCTQEIAQKDSSVTLVVIERVDFNHGSTRDIALRRTTGDIVCFLTQDAMPASSAYLENLVAPLVADQQIALVSGRQLPKADARRFEQLVREFNYPAESSVRSLADLPRLGIKTFFASDVCSAYRRSAYLECGGFPALETNEDMLMAARVIKAGYKVAYASAATVFHSHNLTPSQQYERNRAVGRFLEGYKSDLMVADEIGEGGRLVYKVASSLIEERMPMEFFAFGIDCIARFLGNRRGRVEIRRALKG